MGGRREAVVYIGGTANRVDMTRTRFDMRGAFTACIQQNRQVAGVVTDATRIVLVDTVIEGCASACSCAKAGRDSR